MDDYWRKINKNWLKFSHNQFNTDLTGTESNPQILITVLIICCNKKSKQNRFFYVIVYEYA